MCDYRKESQKAVAALPVPVSQSYKLLGMKAHRALVKAVRDGRARPGRDLYDGKSLLPRELSQGHYMSPRNYNRSLARWNANPAICGWCGGRLPQKQIRQHLRNHNHREEIIHHFHPNCWHARLLAIACIFGHLKPETILQSDRRCRRRNSRRALIVETVEVVAKKLWLFPTRRGRRRR